MPLVSIIVPVYKVEKYLQRCLDSILNQTTIDFECILVDDASPDNCPFICDEYTKKDNRFKVIHKSKNEGLPEARKTGLDAAIGEFIMFVDSDDWIEKNALELLLRKQCETDADIVIGALECVFRYRKKKLVLSNIKENSNLLNCFFEQSILNSLCGRLYRKKMFDNYLVPSFSFGEDAMVNLQIFACAEYKSIAAITNVVYFYNLSSDGMSRPRNLYANDFFDFPSIRLMLWIENYLKRKGLFDNIKNLFLYYGINYCIYNYLRHSKNISKDSIAYIYSNYYLKCPDKCKINCLPKCLIFIYKKSIVFGKLASSILYFISNIRNR